MNTKKVKISIKWEIIGLTLVPLVLLAVIITLYSMNALKDSLEEEALSGLEDVCHSVDAAYSALDDGDYVMDGDELKKGDFNVTKNDELIDSFVEVSDVEITLFYGDTRRATSLVDATTKQKILGTQASQEVTDQVVNKKEDFSSTSLTINNQSFYAYYIPMKNPDGSVVGMVFAGKPSEKVDAMIRTKTMGMLGISLGLLVIAALAVLFIANKLGKAVRKTGVMLNTLSQGDLSIQVDEKLLKRKDELGIMGSSLQELMNKLKGIIGDMKKSADVLAKSGQEMNELADQTNTTVTDISRAMDDVSKGAISQAEDIEEATNSVGEMGESIGKIVTQVDVLNDTSEHMEQAKSEADLIITELSESSERTFEAVNRIEKQVKLTDESVTKIEEAISLISSIAEETNLLSLNASIEAARAGEAGKGFAVVATQIQKLAEESNASATSITEVIDHLAEESRNTVDAMNEMQAIIQEQQEKLHDTKNKFEGVSAGIQTSRSEVKDIKTDTGNCDVARVKVTDVIQNLSAVSEENAAATEETMSAIQELNAMMDLLAAKSDDLKALAQKLEDDMNFFQI